MRRRLSDLADGELRADAFHGAGGAGVRVAVVDSGVSGALVASGGVLVGASFDAAGARGDDTDDRHGHGSAVVATIRALAPGVEILPVKVFDGDLRATVDALVAAIDWAAGAGAHLVNLSLGTTNLAHRLRLGEALVRAARAGATVVAADVDEAGTTWLPGSLPLAVGVSVDRSLARDTAVVSITQEGAVRRIRARAIGAVVAGTAGAAGARERVGGVANLVESARPASSLEGVSFAVAAVTGLLALHLSSRTPA